MQPFTDRFACDPSPASMDALVNHFRVTQVSDEEIAHLAVTLGQSGAAPAFQPDAHSADLASTGGPSSLSTLLGPLYLAALGCTVRALGVPGRPAGAIDVLEQLPGFRVELSRREVERCIAQCRYVHFLGNRDFAPLDSVLFRYRQQVGSQAIPELTIASILSKKIAVGIQRVGLDVRVASHGNLGTTWELARINAARFRRVASILGIEAYCFLTDARFLYQPFLGRGESLAAICATFSERCSPSLASHRDTCLAMAITTSGTTTANMSPLTLEAESIFYRNLVAQGSSQDEFCAYVDRVHADHKFEFLASESGFVRVHVERLRDLVTRFQTSALSNELGNSDAIGIIFRIMPGCSVNRGDVVATIRISDEHWAEVERELTSIIAVDSRLPAKTGFEEVVDG